MLCPVCAFTNARYEGTVMLCSGCNYPIPSWQHQGACKPVEDKVPEIRHTHELIEDMRRYYEARGNVPGQPSVAKMQREAPNELNRGNSGVTENPPALPKRRGRPKKDDSLTAAQKQAAYRARKQQ